MVIRVLNLEPESFNPEALSILESFADVESVNLTREELKEVIAKYDALIVRLGYKIDEEIISKAQNLKAIVTATTGLNHINVQACDNRGIAVLSLKEETDFLKTITATAEHTMGLLLALLRHIPSSYADVQNKNWNRNLFKGVELSGKTIGIIGYGRLGKMVAHYSAAFNMNVLAHDKITIAASDGIRMVSLDEILRTSDIISLHVSYSQDAHNLLDGEAFNVMKKNAIIINTSRGEMIDEEALLKALKEGKIAGAALDVLSGEYADRVDWARHDPLIAYASQHSNLIITPHIGGATYDSMYKTELFMAHKLKAFISSLKNET